MKILILGGTQFIGRHVAEALLAAGHAVTILTRGQTPDPLPRTVERLRGDRDRGGPGLSALKGRAWDACIDVSGYTPKQARPAVERLRESIHRYVYISAVSVYGDPDHRPVLETHPRLLPAGDEITEITNQTYGALKVACEDIVQNTFADRCTLLRPQIVAGPYDPLDRFSYWARRATQPGEMLAPGDGSDHLQFIDARDLARFTRTVVEGNVAGAFNLAGARLTWGQFMTDLAARNLTWVPAHVLKSAGITESELPLYRPEHGPRSSLMHVSNAKAIAAGLRLTDPQITIRDTQTWLSHQDRTPALSPQREAELIRIAAGGAEEVTSGGR